MKLGKIAATAVFAAMIGGVFVPVAAHGESEKEKRFAESQYRHDVMEHFNYSMKKLVPILFKGADHKADLPAIADIMASAATITTTAFEKDTRGMEGHTEAKDKIWDNWEDFSARLEKMQADTAVFAAVAKTGDMAAIVPAFKKVGSNCKSCHDEYKK